MAPAEPMPLLPRPDRATWFALFGAPVAWAAQGLAGWYLEGAACGGQYPIFHVSLGTLRVLEIVLCIAALAAGIAALLVALRLWRASADPALTRVHARERPDFLAACALFVSFAFTVAIAWAALPTLVLPICESMR